MNMPQKDIVSSHGIVKARVIRYVVLRHKLYKPIYNLYIFKPYT